MRPDILDLRSMWALYRAGDWVAVAYWSREFDVAFWDLDGVSCGCTFQYAPGKDASR